MAIDPKAIRRAMMVAKNIAASVSNVPLMRAKGGQVNTIQGPERQQNLDRFMEGAHPALFNKDGTPKILYHGTSKDFSTFKPGTYLGNVHGVGGIYLTSDPHVASEYSRHHGDTGRNVMPVHVNMKNAYVLKKGEYAADAEQLKAQGYDGIIDGDTFVPFHPHQIKSAVGNVGTFDPTNPDITKAKGGEVETVQGPEREQNLKNWLGNSFLHVNGVPKTYYHGTSKDKPFTSFNVGRHGAWFTSDPSDASMYAHQNDSMSKVYEGGKYVDRNTASRVMPVYLKASNPFFGELPEKYKTADNYKKAQSDWFDELRAAGHDSWIPRSQQGNLAVMLEGPHQVKSAIGNDGTFDHPKDITKAEGGDVEASDQEQWPHPVPKENMLKTHHAQRYGTGLPNNIVPENMFDRDENPGISHGTGPYLYALEHIGDLPHRLSYIDDVGGGVGYGIEAALDKTARNYDLRPERLNESLQRNYNFQKRENSFHGSYDDFVKKFEDAADRYAHAYRMIPVHTQLQELGRDAAIALGERDFYTARKNLNEIHRRLSGDNPEQEYWRPVKDLEASNSIAKNTARLERMRRAGGGDVDVKTPVIDADKAIRRAMMIAKAGGGELTNEVQKAAKVRKTAADFLPESLPDTSINSLTKAFTEGINEHMALSDKDRIQNSRAAKKIIASRNGSGALLAKNGKLMKTETGAGDSDPVELPDGRGIETTGLSLAPAFQVGKFNTCPNHASCKASCLGVTSGGNFMFGGGRDLDEIKGPRLAHLKNTLAMILHPKEFAVRLSDEITAAKQQAAANGNKLGVRLNVLSDIHPRAYEALIKAHPDVDFYDYTKLDSNPIAPNHHLTYSSTGTAQPAGVNGNMTDVDNVHQNWRRMRRRLDTGSNVAMAFSHGSVLPEFVHDLESGKKYRVVNGDDHDFRPMDRQAEGADGVIVGLKNKKAFGKEQEAHIDSNGFFTYYDPKIVKDPMGRNVVTNNTVQIAPQPGAKRMMTNDSMPEETQNG